MFSNVLSSTGTSDFSWNLLHKLITCIASLRETDLATYLILFFSSITSVFSCKRTPDDDQKSSNPSYSTSAEKIIVKGILGVIKKYSLTAFSLAVACIGSLSRLTSLSIFTMFFLLTFLMILLGNLLTLPVFLACNACLSHSVHAQFPSSRSKTRERSWWSTLCSISVSVTLKHKGQEK